MALEQYGLNDTDVASNTVTYEGFEDQDGAWYIRRTVKVSSKITETRYAQGGTDYGAAWASRTAQSYATFGATF